MHDHSKPLFNSGIADIEISDCYELFVAPFKNKERRNALMERFFIYYWELSQLRIDVDIWIDGSFVTTKENPSDIDIALIVNMQHIQEMSDEDADSFYALVNPVTTLSRYYLDVRTHEYSEHDRKRQKKNWFSKDKNQNSKGFARIKISRIESDDDNQFDFAGAGR